MTRIRLGIVTVSARLGGTELSLLRLLRAYPRSEFEPHLCVLAEAGPLAEDFRRAGVEFTALGARSMLDLPRLLGVRDWIRKTDPDILHGYIYGAALAVRAFGHSGRVRPVVVAIHLQEQVLGVAVVGDFVPQEVGGVLLPGVEVTGGDPDVAELVDVPHARCPH